MVRRMRRLRMTSGFASKLKNALVCHSGAPAGRPVRRLPGTARKTSDPFPRRKTGPAEVISGSSGVVRRLGRLADQPVEGAERGASAVAHRNDDLLVRGRRAVARGEDPLGVGGAVLVRRDFTPQRLRETTPSSHSVLGVRPICTKQPSAAMRSSRPDSRSVMRIASMTSVPSEPVDLHAAADGDVRGFGDAAAEHRIGAKARAPLQQRDVPADPGEVDRGLDGGVTPPTDDVRFP